MTRTIIKPRARRQARIRSKVKGSETRPRLSVFRSNRYVYAQIINDETGKTIVSARDVESKAKTMRERAKELGKILAGKAKEKKVSQVVFDRAGYSYTGIIREIAEGAREGGLDF